MTTKYPALHWLPLWQAAAAEEIGLFITIAHKEQPLLVNALYACRQESGGFEDMMIFQPQPPGTIYIAHKTVPLDD